ncbi:unnamed protein product [Ambrosiozyma monospora]|uniref:Unnamed protein product n=1 Tax=Ambrosiozyma monospora TaxID=43982 RepID=A0ACB5T751_AMBMO|nr:unnamed protein product [Ambrosiozyma monospora]
MKKKSVCAKNDGTKSFDIDDSSDEEHDDKFLNNLKNREDESGNEADDSDSDSDDDNMTHLNDDQLFQVDSSDEEGDEEGDDDDEDKMDIDSDIEEGDEDNASESDYTSDDSDAWKDSDDEKVSISLLSSDRLKKLRTVEHDDHIKGRSYINRLRTQFERIYPRPEWADAYESEEDKDEDSSDDESTGISRDIVSASTNPLLDFLKQNQTYNLQNKNSKLLPTGKIDIIRLTDANIKKISKSGIQALSFHKSHPLLLTGGFDKTLRLYHIDGKINNLVTSLHFKNLPIASAGFANGAEQIFAGGRRRFMYKWDLSSGSVDKISRLYGHENTQRSFENFKVSNSGKFIGLTGNSGWINILSTKTGQWIRGFKVEGTLIDFDFSLNTNGHVFLVAVNTAGEVWEFDVDNGKILNRWQDYSGVGITKVRIGGERNNRWLAIGNNLGIVNVYDRLKFVEGKTPKPVGVIENLVTSISTIEFSPDGQIMCIVSRSKRDALRLIHLPSCKVFSNWPTSGTPLGRVTAVAFSPAGEMLATGNDVGKVRLWRLNHY